MEKENENNLKTGDKIFLDEIEGNLNRINIAFKYIPIGVEFEHKGQEYIKTNFQRGYYFENGKKILRHFKKRTVVNTTSECFNI